VLGRSQRSSGGKRVGKTLEALVADCLATQVKIIAGALTETLMGGLNGGLAGALVC
jgi:hypothetical protein